MALIDARASGFTVNFAVRVVRPSDADTVTMVLVPTLVVVALYVPLLTPAGIMIDAGTETVELVLVKFTVMPPAGATLVSVTDPVTGALPPTVEVALSECRLIVTGTIETLADFVTVLKVPEIEAVVVDATTDVVTVKGAVVAPAETVTDDGTRATEVFDDLRLITIPPEGAGPVRRTVPAPFNPPVTDPGLIMTELRLTGFSVSVVERDDPL